MNWAGRHGLWPTHPLPEGKRVLKYVLSPAIFQIFHTRRTLAGVVLALCLAAPVIRAQQKPALPTVDSDPVRSPDPETPKSAPGEAEQCSGREQSATCKRQGQLLFNKGIRGAGMWH